MSARTLLFVLGLGLSFAAMSHPSSGIAANSDGTVFFIDTGAGVWELERNGTLTKIPGRAYHWLAIDRSGRWTKAELPVLSDASIERTRHDVLISGDFPIAVDAKGGLYVPRKQDDRVRILRFEPSGESTLMATVAVRRDGTAPGWIDGSAVGPDGSFYYTEDYGVWKVGEGKTAIEIPVQIPRSECRSVPGLNDDPTAPMYQGIDVDAKGNVFVAVTGCQMVIKIAPNKPISTLIRTTGAWSPTSVAVFGNELYVLEFLHTASHDRREWIPRIRKIAADGTDSIIATVQRKQRN